MHSARELDSKKMPLLPTLCLRVLYQLIHLFPDYYSLVRPLSMST